MGLVVTATMTRDTVITVIITVLWCFRFCAGFEAESGRQDSQIGAPLFTYAQKIGCGDQHGRGLEAKPLTLERGAQAAASSSPGVQGDGSPQEEHGV